MCVYLYITCVCVCVCISITCVRPSAGQNAAPGSHSKRSQTTVGEGQEEGGVALRKPSSASSTSSTSARTGLSSSRSAPPASPLLGNANNPNKADIPDRKKGATTGPAVRHTR